MITLSPVSQPYPLGFHPSFDIRSPDEDRFEIASREFRDRFELYYDEVQRERLSKAHVAQFAAMMYRTGSDELLQVASDLLLWVFALDDEYFDEGPSRADSVGLMQVASWIQRSVESPEIPVCQDRYALALRDIRQRLDRYATPGQVGRFVDGVRSYLMAELWKAQTACPGLNDYMMMRFHSGAGWIFVPVLQHVVAGIKLSTAQYEDRRVRALAEMMLWLAQWDLEPYSYAKEQARDDQGREHNAISILLREHGKTIEQALARHALLRARVFSLFQRLYNVVITDAAPVVRAYLDGMTEVYSGNVFWGSINHRYRSLSGLETVGAFRGGDVVNSFPEERFEALGNPAFDWWWTYDPIVNPAC